VTIVAVFAVFVLTQCKTTQPRPDYFPMQTTSAQALETWMGGDEQSARAAVEDIGPQSSIPDLFAGAEIDFWSGNVERAFERYLAMLEKEPGHALNRFAAARVYGLRNDIVRYEERLAPFLKQVRYRQVHPLGRVYLSLSAQSVQYDVWQRTRAPEPFSGDSLGFPSRWMTTPMLSPWRLTDFDRTFAPETQESLAESYLSPYVAEDAPVNYERSRPFVANGINLSPPFESNGVHYLETFVTVEPAEDGGARDFLVYASGAGALEVRIDGELVTERREGSYGTNKRFRRVRLAPGEHRILVKMGFQSGYRDWFDLVLLADDAHPLAESGLDFREARQSDGDLAGIELLGEMKLPHQLEPVLVEPGEVADADDISLYLTTLAGYFDLQPEYFLPAWTELMERNEGFAAGYSIRGYQIQTMWEIPSRIRDARALSNIRSAHEYDPESLAHVERLVYWLRQQGGDEQELEDFLDQARSMARAEGDGGELLSVGPLVSWADYLGDKGWNESAEDAWKRVLELNPTNCRAATELQSLYYNRNHYPALATITPQFEHCPRLEERLVFERDDRDDKRLAHLRADALRNPFSASTQIRYAEELVAHGNLDEARSVLRDARDRMPWSQSLWSELANVALANDGKDAAIRVLNDALDENGRAGWLAWRTALLENDLPLESVMPDGLEAARQEAERRPVGEDVEADRDEADYVSDDAYYVVDFAATKYLPDGSSVTLTHTVVRVMTKGAIDRFGERSLPGGAHVLLSRTIKQDGSTRTPERTPGKSTLSMPGLAEGDFVEFAYVEYNSAPAISKTYTEGTRFYFRMGNISSVRSEFVLLGRLGEFIRENDAPEAEPVETEDGDGVRFIRRDSPRPRDEPHMVSWTEFLPWVQMYRLGVQTDPFEIERRYQRESLVDATKMSRQLEEQIEAWRADSEPGTPGEIRDLFYDVSGWFTERSLTDFSTDASHALIQRDGNPIVVLHTAFDSMGVDSDVYLAKSKVQHPKSFPVQEFRTYGVPLLRVTMPDGSDQWLVPDGPDAMFGMMSPMVQGQPAVCLSCEEKVVRTVPDEGFEPSGRDIEVDAKLSADGTLQGTSRLTFGGMRAAGLRGGLRRTTEESARRKYMDRILSSQLPGATLLEYEILDEEDPGQPLTIVAEFERKNFARGTADGTLRIQTQLFAEPLASAYAELSTRTTPMMIKFHRDHSYRFSMQLPDGYSLASGAVAGETDSETPFGRYERELSQEGDELVMTSDLMVPIQRIGPEQYAEFQSWALAVEQSALFRVDLEDK
jgi:tetratricopeptide (TPR) repeat protein